MAIGLALLLVVVAAVGAYALLGHATPTPTPTAASPAATATPDTGSVICGAYASISTVASGDALAVAQAFVDHANDLDVTAVASSASEHAPRILSALAPVARELLAITYPSDPALLVDLRTATAAFASAAQSWERFAQTGTSYVPDFYAGMDSLTSAKTAVLSATDEVNRLEAAGTLSCP